MNKVIKKIVLLFVFITFLLPMDVFAAPARWPMLHNNMSNTRNPFVSVTGFETLAPKWETEINAHGCIAVDSATNTIYIYGEFGYQSGDGLTAVNNNGSIKWRWPLPSDVYGHPDSLACPVIADDGTVYITGEAGDSSQSHKLYAINSNGSLKWSVQLDQDVYCQAGKRIFSPAIDSSGNIIVTAEACTPFSMGLLASFSPSGSQNWRKEYDSFFQSAPIIAPNGDICLGEYGINYALDDHRNGMSCFNGINGNRKNFYLTNKVTTWMTSDSAKSFEKEVAIGSDGTVYAVLNQNDSGKSELYSLKPLTNGEFQLNWTKVLNSENKSSTPFLHDNKIYVENGWGYDAFNINGDLLFKVVGVHSALAPSVISNNGYIYSYGQYRTTTSHGAITVSKVSDGSRVFYYNENVPYPLYHFSPAIGADGTIYAFASTTSNTKLVAFGPAVVVPTITFSASPTTVSYGAAANLSWTTTNATSCSIDQGLGSATPVASGSKSTGALTSSKTFTITCTGPGGSTSRSVGVSVLSPPAGSFTASASVYRAGTPTYGIVTTKISDSEWSAGAIGTPSVRVGDRLDMSNILKDINGTIITTDTTYVWRWKDVSVANAPSNTINLPLGSISNWPIPQSGNIEVSVTAISTVGGVTKTFTNKITIRVPKLQQLTPGS